MENGLKKAYEKVKKYGSDWRLKDIYLEDEYENEKVYSITLTDDKNNWISYCMFIGCSNKNLDTIGVSPTIPDCKYPVASVSFCFDELSAIMSFFRKINENRSEETIDYLINLIEEDKKGAE